jgi:hypothetical protein
MGDSNLTQGKVLSGHQMCPPRLVLCSLEALSLHGSL